VRWTPLSRKVIAHVNSIMPRDRKEWQARKDSNPRPSVLETDALTRLSYAPTAGRKFYPTPQLASLNG
jgi:hypothetical protein